MLDRVGLASFAQHLLVVDADDGDLLRDAHSELGAGARDLDPDRIVGGEDRHRLRQPGDPGGEPLLGAAGGVPPGARAVERLQGALRHPHRLGEAAQAPLRIDPFGRSAVGEMAVPGGEEVPAGDAPGLLVVIGRGMDAGMRRGAADVDHRDARREQVPDLARVVDAGDDAVAVPGARIAHLGQGPAVAEQAPAAALAGEADDAARHPMVIGGMDIHQQRHAPARAHGMGPGARLPGAPLGGAGCAPPPARAAPGAAGAMAQAPVQVPAGRFRRGSPSPPCHGRR